MGNPRLDQNLLGKISKRSKRSLQRVREQISHMASRRGISSEAAQVLLAKELGISATRVFQNLPAHVQQQARDSLPSLIQRRPNSQSGTKGRTRPRQSDPFRYAVDYLIADQDLRDRCADLLRAKGKFDRVIREATTVLDDRLKTLGGITSRMNPDAVVGKVLNPNPQDAVLVVSPEPAEQQGFHSICKGLMLAFRNPAHHKLSDKITREEALKMCAFVDAVLTVLGQAKKNPSAATP